MSTIVFLTTYSFDEPVVRNRLTPFMNLALDKGFYVTLISPRGGEYERSSDKRFYRVALQIPQANRGNFVVRAFREVSLAKSVLESVNSNYDYVFITIPSMFLLFFSGRIQASKRFLDIRDLTWEYLSDRGILTRFAKRFFRILALKKIPTFDYVSVTNRTEESYLLENVGVPAEKIAFVPNGIGRHQFESVSPDSIYEKINNKPIVAYVGNVGIAQNLVTLVNAAKRLPEIEFWIVGAGTDYDRVAAEAARVPNVVMKGRVDWYDIPPVYLEADVLYAQLSEDFAGAMPSKLYEYLATGKPVIYGGQGEARMVLSQFDCVKVIRPNNPEELTACIQSLIDNATHTKINLANRRLIESQFIREEGVKMFFRKVLGI